MRIEWKINPQRAYGEGYYDGASEDSLLHSFLSYNPALRLQLKKLKRELKQESILLVKSKVNYEVV